VSRELAMRDHGPAAFAIAEMYDPRGWRSDSSPFSKPNAAKAGDWYGRAAAQGVPGAAEEAAAMRRHSGDQ
jgi:serine/threonine-protein kinase